MADSFVCNDRSGAGRVHVTDSVDESRSAAEQRAYESRRLDRTLRSERASEQNADRSKRTDLACYRHGVLLQEKKGNTRPRCGRTEVPRSGCLRTWWREGFGHRTRCRARKKKAPGPCELRALLRDEPSSPCTRHGRRRVTWHRQTLRSDNASYCSGARPSAQPKSLARQDRNGFRSLQGRVTTATPIPRYWTSCMAG
jgi:hypothetical protein